MAGTATPDGRAATDGVGGLGTAIPPGADLRLPEYRREIFQRFYTFHLRYRTHPGCVYHLLPAIDPTADVEQRAWIAWLNGCTQNPVTTMLLYQAGPGVEHWQSTIDYWNKTYADLEFDTDRRHQKARFADATEAYASSVGAHPAAEWRARAGCWKETWEYARSLPHMGRLSAWSLIEYVRILVDRAVPDAETLLLEDWAGSRSHRNGLAVVAGYPEAAFWPAEAEHGRLEEWREFGVSLRAEARRRNPGDWTVGYLTMESALCTYKSWHKPNRRYPNVYADMAYLRLKRAEARFGYQFDALWEARRRTLPSELRLETSPYDPGLCRQKQNHYRETGQVLMMGYQWPELMSDFDRAVQDGSFGRRAL